MRIRILILFSWAIGLFSGIHSAGSATFVVDKNTDLSTNSNLVPGELRWAITQANTTQLSDVIEFNIPGANPVIIQLSSELPEIMDPLTIDGNSQSGIEPINNKKIIIRGTNSMEYIFRIGPLRIYKSTGSCTSPSGSVIVNLEMESALNGVIVDLSDNISIRSNVFHSITHHSIILNRVSGGIIQGNIFGAGKNLVVKTNGPTSKSFIKIEDGSYVVLNKCFTKQGPGSIPTPAESTSPGPAFNNLIGGFDISNRNFFIGSGSDSTSQECSTYNSTDPAGVEILSAGNRVVNNFFKGLSRNIYLDTIGNLQKSPPVFVYVFNSTSWTTEVNLKAEPFDFIEIYHSKNGIDANKLMAGGQADSSGNFKKKFDGFPGYLFIATSTDKDGNTSEFSSCSKSTSTYQSFCNYEDFFAVKRLENEYIHEIKNGEIIQACSAESLQVDFFGCDGITGLSFLWEVRKDDSLIKTSEQRGVSLNFSGIGLYNLSIIIKKDDGVEPPQYLKQEYFLLTRNCFYTNCRDCIGSFSPDPGKEYNFSAWVKSTSQDQAGGGYSSPSVYIDYPESGSLPSHGPFIASGTVIDGWQKIDTSFIIPSAAVFMSVRLDCKTEDCYFDDIRIAPFNSTIKSFVYDPVTLRLVAELDERNFASFYEYDEEGKLIRVKKETERGIMTISENRSSQHRRYED